MSMGPLPGRPKSGVSEKRPAPGQTGGARRNGNPIQGRIIAKDSSVRLESAVAGSGTRQTSASSTRPVDSRVVSTIPTQGHRLAETVPKTLAAETIPQTKDSSISPQRKDSSGASSASSPAMSGRLSPIKLRTSLITAQLRTSSAATPPISASSPETLGPSSPEVISETAQERLTRESERLNDALRKLQEHPAVEDAEIRIGSMLSELRSRVAQCLMTVTDKAARQQPLGIVDTSMLSTGNCNAKSFDALLHELYDRLADCSQRVSTRMVLQGTEPSSCSVPSTLDWGQKPLEQAIANFTKSAQLNSDLAQRREGPSSSPRSTKQELEELRSAIETMRAQVELTHSANARLEHKCEEYRSQVDCLLHVRKLKARTPSPPKVKNPQHSSVPTRLVAVKPRCVEVIRTVTVQSVSREASPSRQVSPRRQGSPVPSSLPLPAPITQQLPAPSPLPSAAPSPHLPATPRLQLVRQAQSPPGPLSAPPPIGLAVPRCTWQVPAPVSAPIAPKQQIRVVAPSTVATSA